MGIAALIFTILGMIASVYTFIWVNWVLGAIGIAIGIWMIIGLCLGKKNIAAGILGILFTGIIGGILYLCWDGDKLGD
jgi:hypothetical protein